MEKIKLQKFFSDMGIMSRRAAETEISLGKVKVNGEVASLGMRISPETDIVEYKGKRIFYQENEKIYVMLNKPRGYVTTLSDEKGRPTVTSLVKIDGTRLYPIGRLDMDSDGLLLLTNDGELTNILTHPRHEIPKIYHVTVRGRVSADILQKLSSEMEIDGYKILPVKTELVEAKEKYSILCMTLFEGRNRQIRKMCDLVGLEITRLSRIAIGTLELASLPSGKWRFLKDDEVSYLKGNRP
ncbi:MAG: rRNA pseudouridine synthase [Clostridia bacterium]|jgi:23S rRNA pseudouridine2605 synthase|nr:rRNA pseudouridine synthase [Clostridia bacterium]